MTDDQERAPEVPLAPPSPQMDDLAAPGADATGAAPGTPPAAAPEGAPMAAPPAPAQTIPEPPAAAPAAPPTAAPGAPPPPAPSYAWDQPGEPAGPAPGVKFAGHPGRLVAYIIDGFILGIIASVLIVAAFVVLGVGLTTDDGGSATVGSLFVIGFTVGILLVLLVTLAYFPFFWVRSGSTPGMRVFGLRVVRDADGGPISWGTGIFRYVIFLLLASFSLLGLIGFGWILVDSRRRGWHDLAAGTCVIQRA
jgi:uncharacterized RDD family membrane protein YckC